MELSHEGCFSIRRWRTIVWRPPIPVGTLMALGEPQKKTMQVMLTELRGMLDEFAEAYFDD